MNQLILNHIADSIQAHTSITFHLLDLFNKIFHDSQFSCVHDLTKSRPMKAVFNNGLRFGS